MNAFEIKAIMLDPARLIEQRSVYSEFLKRFADWGYNTLFWHFCDDEGCRLKFPSHPELASAYAWTPEEMRDFIAEADALGIQVIPEVETLGHTGFITKHERYRHLRDGVSGKAFSALAPLHPESQSLLADLLRDAAEIFPSPWVHVGLDESAFGEHPHTAQLLESKDKPEIFTDHIHWLHAQLQSHGKGMMIWGDHLRPTAASNMADLDHLDESAVSERIAEGIPKDIVVCDWYYREDLEADRLDCFLDKGFRVIACPAPSSYGMLAYPPIWALENIRRFIALARANVHRGVIGVSNTSWASGRHLTHVLFHGHALGAHLMNHETESPEFISSLLKNLFGLDDAAVVSVEEALSQLVKASPDMFDLNKAFPVNTREAQSACSASAQRIIALEPSACRALELLRSARGQVSRCHADFDELILTARTIHWLAQIVQARENDPAQLSEQLTAGKQLLEDLSSAWDRTRHADDPEKWGSAEGGCGYLLQRIKHGLAMMENSLNRTVNGA